MSRWGLCILDGLCHWLSKREKIICFVGQALLDRTSLEGEQAVIVADMGGVEITSLLLSVFPLNTCVTHDLEDF